MEKRIDSDEPPEAAPPDMGLGRIVRAIGYSMAGFAAAWRCEAAFRQEALAALVLIPVACLLPVPILQRALLVASVLMVMVIELINSSIEAAIDRISLDRHALSKRAKDIGSASVFLAIAITAILWATVLCEWFFGLPIG
jgi:diacylglycerol kinase (ATP)